MKLQIEVSDRRQAEAVKRALADPQTLDLIAVMGELLALPDHRAQSLLNNLGDSLEELKDAANVRGEKI